jgi:DNA-binding response OmpR family regulator
MLDRAEHSILVVDDHEASRYALSRGLRALDYHVLEAAAGAQALELAEYVSAIVLDVHLPDLHGMEVCRLLRARPRTATMPIVHVSAKLVSPQDVAAGHQAGADAYLIAPVSPEEVAAQLDDLLSRKA